MPAFETSTLLVSAGTSAIVAIAVEWIAKPRLEARKERLLHRYRARHELRRCLETIFRQAAMMYGMGRFPSPRPPAILTLLDEGSAEIRRLSLQVTDLSTDIRWQWRPRSFGLLGAYSGALMALQALPDLDWEQRGAAIGEVTMFAGNALFAPWWMRPIWLRRAEAYFAKL